MSKSRLYPEAVRDGTATATAVYATLARADEPLTYATLADETGASDRAIRTAVGHLRDAGLVVSEPVPQDPNKKQHRLAGGCEEFSH